jgi:5-aminopentanamidase
MKIACVQTIATSLSEYKGVSATIERLIDEAGTQKCDLMVFPESVYPAYYLGENRELLDKALLDNDHVISLVAGKAKKYSCYIAFGMIEREEEKLYNAALLFNTEGKIISKIRKSFLWHFDSNWFSSGNEYEVVDTEFGKWAMIICADGRMPEIPRQLALEGADLIIDLANLTSTGKDKTQLTNAQCGYMLSVRALENRTFLVMADKAGVEADTVTYAGRSCVISPSGEILVEASPYEEEILYIDVDLDTKKNTLPDLIGNRQPDTYKELYRPSAELAITHVVNDPIVPQNMVIQGSTTQFTYTSKSEYIQKANRYIHILEDQGASLLVLPQFNGEFEPGEIQFFIKKEETYVFMASNCQIQNNKYITGWLITKSGIKEIYHKIHLNESEKKLFKRGDEYKVIKTPKGNIGIMIGEDGLYPEVARILALKGSDCVIWINHLDPIIQEKIARTRSAENKVFILTNNQLNINESAFSFIADPNGSIISSTLIGREQATAVQIPVLLSRCKDIVPLTNAIFDRRPDLYKLLAEGVTKVR